MRDGNGAGAPMVTEDGQAVLVRLRGLSKHFDVSPPLLSRLLEGKRRRVLKAVDGVDLDIPRGQRRPWWANRAAASPPWRACWSPCTGPPPAI